MVEFFWIQSPILDLSGKLREKHIYFRDYTLIKLYRKNAGSSLIRQIVDLLKTVKTVKHIGTDHCDDGQYIYFQANQDIIEQTTDEITQLLNDNYESWVKFRLFQPLTLKEITAKYLLRDTCNLLNLISSLVPKCHSTEHAKSTIKLIAEILADEKKSKFK